MEVKIEQDGSFTGDSKELDVLIRASLETDEITKVLLEIKKELKEIKKELCKND